MFGSCSTCTRARALSSAQTLRSQRMVEKLRPLIPSVVLRGASTNPAGTLARGVFGGGVNDRMSDFAWRSDFGNRMSAGTGTVAWKCAAPPAACVRSWTSPAGAARQATARARSTVTTVRLAAPGRLEPTADPPSIVFPIRTLLDQANLGRRK